VWCRPHLHRHQWIVPEYIRTLDSTGLEGLIVKNQSSEKFKIYFDLTSYQKRCHCTWPPLWSSGQSSWLQIQRSGFDSQRYQIFWKVLGLERGPLSLVSTTEELLERKSSSSDLESRENGRRDPSRWPRGTLY
jgi:hypothetical protein